MAVSTSTYSGSAARVPSAGIASAAIRRSSGPSHERPTGTEGPAMTGDGTRPPRGGRGDPGCPSASSTPTSVHTPGDRYAAFIAAVS